MDEPASSDRFPQRLISLDQFRGYTVMGMLLVNFLGGYRVVPELLKHHNTYQSYADTIMPQFFFAVGFAFRWTFTRRLAREGARSAYLRVLRRLLGLGCVALVIHAPGSLASDWNMLRSMEWLDILARVAKSGYFQTLTHITCASLWITPVIHASGRVRAVYACGSILLHAVLSWWFNFTWIWTEPRAIDGGPLGFLTWSVPTWGGTLACDLVQSRRHVTRRLILIGASLAVMGWLGSCGTRWYDQIPGKGTTLAGAGLVTGEGTLAVEPVIPLHGRSAWGWAEPPFVPPPESRLLNYWMMSQRGGTPTYLIFATGFSLLLFAAFYVLGDRGGFAWPVFTTFGSNALVAYVVHSLVDLAIRPYAPSDSPVAWVAVATGVFFAANYAFLHSLERQRIFLRM